MKAHLKGGQLSDLDSLTEVALREILDQANLTEVMARRVETVVRSLSRDTLAQYLSLHNIKAGFARTGLWPFKPEVILANIRGITRAENKTLAKLVQQAVPKVLRLAQ